MDSLYLSIWFPSFRDSEMVPRAVSVLRQFLFSAAARRSDLPLRASRRVERAHDPGTALRSRASRRKRLRKSRRSSRTTTSPWYLRGLLGFMGAERRRARRSLGAAASGGDSSWSTASSSMREPTPTTDISRSTSGSIRRSCSKACASPGHRNPHPQQRREARRLLRRRGAALRHQRPRAVVGVGRQPGPEADRETAADAVKL